MNKLSQELSLEEIKKAFNMPTRAYNVCKDHNLLTAEDLIAFYKKNLNFDKFKNSGKKTQIELEEICIQLCELFDKNAETGLLNTDEILPDVPVVEYVRPEDLSLEQSMYLNYLVKQKWGSLPLENQNLTKRFLRYTDSYKDFYIFFIQKNKGNTLEKRLSPEEFGVINALWQQISDDAKVVKNKPVEFFDYELNKIKLFNEFGLDARNSDAFFSRVENKALLFRFFDFAIEKSFEAKRVAAVISHLKWFNDADDKHYQIKEVNLNRETIRLIAKKEHERFDTILKDFNKKNIFYDFIKNIYLEMAASNLILDESFLKKINFNEKTNFSNPFFVIVLQYIYSDHYTIVGSNTKLFKNKFFVKTELAKKVDFDGLLANLQGQINELTHEDYLINLDGYILSHLVSGNTQLELDMLDQAKEVLIAIILNELSNIVGLEGNYLKFYRKSKKPIWEYVQEALKCLGKPSKVEIILETVHQINPALDFSLEKIRSSMIKEKDIFISISRSSTYALREWEHEQDNVQGGAIRDIVERLLTKGEMPIHIYDIANEVLKYRPDSNIKSIHNNLQSDKSNRFQELGGSFWGLSKVNYSFFYIKKFPNHTTKTVKKWFLDNSHPPIENLKSFLAKQFGVSEPQINLWIDEKIRSGFLILADGKITLGYEN